MILIDLFIQVEGSWIDLSPVLVANSGISIFKNFFSCNYFLVVVLVAQFKFVFFFDESI